MSITDVPTGPWHKVGIDFFHLKGKDYLVVIDYFSNYPEMAFLSSTSSNCVITHAKSIFARHGIPHTAMSDNGPCFINKEWQDFTKVYDFKHFTSIPLYAPFNGNAEKGVPILKQLLKKASDSDTDPYLALQSITSGVRPVTCWAADEKKAQNNTSNLFKAKEAQ